MNSTQENVLDDKLSRVSCIGNANLGNHSRCTCLAPNTLVEEKCILKESIYGIL